MGVYRIEGSLGADGKIVFARKIEFENETHLEQLFENSPIGLVQDESILWIGKQPRVQNEDRTIIPDLLGIDSEGYLVIVEFKRGRTPRDVIAQLFVYAAWASELSETEIIGIADKYFSDPDAKVSNFSDHFRDVFDIPDESEIPKLNQNLRLFIVAEEIPDEVYHVCQWQRTSLGLDITCIEVSLFQTDSNETYIDMEVKVGEEDINAMSYPNYPERMPKSSQRDIIYEIVKQLTRGDKPSTWTINEVSRKVLEKHPDFKKNTVTGSIQAGCVNSDSRSHHPGGKDRYWKVKRGIYKLYDPQTDKEESEGVPAAK